VVREEGECAGGRLEDVADRRDARSSGSTRPLLAEVAEGTTYINGERVKPRRACWGT
jgi:hypothetical protein